ncbi:aminopeptidase P family protein [Candidatus Gottesmanbacteria bacterium]|nr:aminopeptidase P family protein [Candidatus Gottesmanbacteria bacterium]
MQKRIAEIVKILNKINIDALFISSQANVTYLTKFAGLDRNEREAFLLITKNCVYLLTFPTLFALYKQNQNIKAIQIDHKTGLTNLLADFFRKEKIKKAAFEKSDMTVAEFQKLRKKTSFVSWRQTENVIENLRLYKDKQEIDCIKQACRIADRALAFILQHIRQGQTEKELAVELEYFIKRNADDVAFSPIVAFGKNAAVPHYLPSNSQRLKTGSLILFDLGAKVNNYCSDITRVVFFGTPDTKFVKIYNTVLSAQEIAIRHLGGGRMDSSRGLIPRDSPEVENSKKSFSFKASVLDKLIKDFIKTQGFPPYPHGLGHGVGIEVHESPRLRIDSKEILLPNMTFTIEPGIYIEDWGGVRIEDLVLLKEDGIEILTKSPKLLRSLNTK